MDIPNHPIMIPLSFSSAGQNIVIPAVTDGWIYVHQILLIADGGDNTVTIKKDTSPSETILSYIPLKSGEGFIIENTRPNLPYLFDLEQNVALDLDLANATSVKGHIIYSVRR